MDTNGFASTDLASLFGDVKNSLSGLSFILLTDTSFLCFYIRFYTRHTRLDFHASSLQTTVSYQPRWNFEALRHSSPSGEGEGYVKYPYNT